MGKILGTYKIETEEQLRAVLEEYLTKDEDNDGIMKPSAWDGNHFKPTVSGLARALGVSRRTINNYSRTDEYGEVIEMFRSIVEENLERGLYGQAVTGLIFNLKNNFGWKDKNEVEHTSKIVDDETDEF